MDPERLEAEGVTRPMTLLRLEEEMGRGRYEVQVGRKAAELGLSAAWLSRRASKPRPTRMV